MKTGQHYVLLFVSVIAFAILPKTIFAQANKRIDSLLNVLENTKEDTIRLNTLMKLSFELRANNSEKALKYAQQGLALAKKIGNKKSEARAMNNIGLAFFYKSEFDSAISYYGNTLKLGNSLGDSSVISLAYNQMGNVYKSKNNFPLSVEFHKRALAIRVQMKDTILQAQSHLNLGNVYVRNSQYELAIQSYLTTLELLKSRPKTVEYANTLNGIGNVYLYQQNYQKALAYYMQGYYYSKKEEDVRGINTFSMNIGNTYKYLKNYDSALFYLQRSLEMTEKTQNKNNMAEVYLTISNVYEDTKQYNKAIEFAKKSNELYKELGLNSQLTETQLYLAQQFLKSGNITQGRRYLEKGLVYADSIGEKHVISGVFDRIAQCYSLLGENDKAYQYLQKSAILKDSLYASNNIQAIAQMQSTFDLKSKENEIELLNREKQISDYKINKQQTIIFSLIGSAVLFILLVFFIYRGYKKTKVANTKLSHAYEVINEKNKNISDSILYAKNIQNALLKIPEYFDQRLKDEYFILYRPKDVVSGDFYWVEQSDKLILLAAADCTGHGVPGSLMSMLGIEKLKQAVREKGLTSPSDILSFVNRSFKETLSVAGTDVFLRDGMDIALCCLNLPENTMQYAGANRPLWIITGNDKMQKELIEIKPTKSAIGGFTEYEQQFSSHSYSPKKGDTIYLFTDGFADQFGGEENKKFNLKQFRELLLSISHLPMPTQQRRLEETFDDWKGDYEQIDDVLVIGITKN